MVGSGLVGRILDAAVAHPGVTLGGFFAGGFLARSHVFGDTSHSIQQAMFGDPYAFRTIGTNMVGARLGADVEYRSPLERGNEAPPSLGDIGVKRIGSRPPYTQYQPPFTPSPYTGPDGSIVFGMYNTRM